MVKNRGYPFHIISALFAVFTVVTSSIIIHPNSQQVLQGSDITLHCKFNSTDTCVWNLKNQPIIGSSFGNYNLSSDPKNGNCNLTIKNVTLERDDGNWYCSVPMSNKHPAGILSNFAHLEVIVSPTPPNILHEGLKVNNNSEIQAKPSPTTKTTFICETRFGNPASTIYWKMDGFNRYNGSLTVTDEKERKKLKRTTNILDLVITFRMNAKNLTCIVEHSFNVTETISVNLNVMYKTNFVNITTGSFVNVNEGEGIQFDCEANGNPHPNFEWRFKQSNKNDWQKINNKSNFSVIATRNNEGTYLCLAGNTDTMLWSREMTVTVSERPAGTKVALVPGIFCAIAAVALFIIILIFVLKDRKKKFYQQKNDVSTPASNQEPIKVLHSRQVAGVSRKKNPNNHRLKNIYSQNRSKSCSSLDSDGYMIARRPLPPIKEMKEVESDQYIGYDPANDTISTISGSPATKSDTCLYEEPHIYENSAMKTLSSITV